LNRFSGDSVASGSL